MGLAQKILSKLLGVSAYAPSEPAYTPPANVVEDIRKAMGGNIVPLPITQTRWYLAEVESAIREADGGNIQPAATLCRSLRRDGCIAGLLATRTDGLVRLPKRFFGPSEMVSELEERNGTRSIFDEMCPASELALLAADGILLGVGIAELVPVDGRDYPVMVRLDPANLYYRWTEDRWYYRSIAGLLPIVPGDGRWVLHVPGGRTAPWQNGLWAALGRSWVNKEHALMCRANYVSKLANPARAAVAPIGASDDERRGFAQELIQWGLNTVFDLPVGWDVKIVESNGTGYQVFQAEIDTADREFMIALAGQVVSTEGGSGFISADLFRAIRSDLIKATADALAYTLNTQVIPQWVVSRYGIDAIDDRPIVEWDVRPAKDLASEASSLLTVAQAIAQMTAALQPYQRVLDVGSLSVRFGIPLADDTDGDGQPDVVATPPIQIAQPPTAQAQEAA